MIALGPWRWACWPMRSWSAHFRVSADAVLIQAAFAKAWGRVQPRQSDRIFLLSAVRATRPSRPSLTPSCTRNHRLCRHQPDIGDAYVVNRKLVPFSTCWRPLHGAIVCLASCSRSASMPLRLATARALWHGDDPDPRLYHPLSPDRLYLSAAACEHQSGMEERCACSRSRCWRSARY